MRTALTIVLVAWCAGDTRTFYVDNAAGNDSNTGLSAQAAHASFGKAVPQLDSGDTLHIVNTGHPYRETLDMTVSGSAGLPVVIEGNQATVTGLDTLAKGIWTQHSGQIYHADIPGYNAPKPMVNGGRFGTAASVGELSENKHVMLLISSIIRKMLMNFL